jgi:hypothetical protein
LFACHILDLDNTFWLFNDIFIIYIAMAGEADGKAPLGSRYPPAALNERILSSMSQKHVAAHPWHDLEIGTLQCFTQNIFFSVQSFPCLCLNYSVL